MTDIINCICCNCKRIVPMNELTVFEGRDYHSSCYLKIVRTRISEIDKKVQRGTATILDAKELQKLVEIERSVIGDIEHGSPDFGRNSEKPLFFGNTTLGLNSVMNPPTWKRILHETGTLEGTKFHMHQSIPIPEYTVEPVLKIITDEHGYKTCIQIGSKPLNTTTKQIYGNNEPTFPVQHETKFLKDNLKLNKEETHQVIQ